jgi:plastocyanin
LWRSALPSRRIQARFRSPVHALSASALTFNGSSYVQVPNSPSLSVPTNLTVEAWMRPTSVPGFQDIVGKTGYELAVQKAGSGFQVQFQTRIAGGWTTATTPTTAPLTLNRWYHVAGTFDGNNMRLYVDGVLRDTQPMAGSIDTTTAPLRIATVDATNDNFVGTIDEVRVSRVLRYSANFTAPTLPFSTDANTAGLWHLDEGSGTTTADASSNANNGTFVGTPTWTADTPFVTSDTTPPAIANVATTNVGSSGATIVWTTDELATSRVEFGPTASYGISSTYDQTLVVNHSVTLAALTSNTTYHYRIVTADFAGNQSTSPDLTFTTGAPNPASATIGEWAPAMNWPLVGVHAILLNTGEIMTWDAWETGGTPSVRLWNPSTQAFTSVPNTWSQIFCSGQVVLGDGRILVVGGHNGGEVGIKDVNIFDPATRNWTLAANMKFARWYPGATELADGRVLALSGNSVPGSWSNTPEVYNPANNTWTSLAVSTADVKEGEYPLSYQLPNGKVFIIAPSTGLTRLLDVGAQTYGASGLATAPLINGSAAMYRPGKILYSGGGPLNGSSVTTAAVVDMNAATPAWRTVAPMAAPRYEHNLTVLPTGQVLAVGGTPDVDQTSHNGSRAAELWDPATEGWTTMAVERDIRQYHSTSVLLPDGRVLSAGGGRWSTAIDYLTAEIYSPPYLFKGPRPIISAAPATTTYGGNIGVDTPDAASIASVSLTSLGANTHTSDMDTRYIDLTFTSSPTGLNVIAPANATIAPPGFYLLWIVNANGVPSFARTIQITAPTTTDTTPPTASMTAPTAGTTVTGSTVAVSATASDNVGVSGVQFTLDGSNLGNPVPTAPYAITWDSTKVANGTHTLGARAFDAAGNTGTAAAVSISVSNVDTTPPTMSAVSAGTPTASAATITWTTNEPADSQVEYGTTTSYGASTILNASPVSAHSAALAGLTPTTLYHYRVKSTDAAGNLATSADLSFTTAAPAPPTLVGNQSIETTQDGNAAGLAEAFLYTATTTGSSSAANVYIDAANGATKVIVGVYTNTASNTPGTLLGQGSLTPVKAGAWNQAPLSGVSILAAQKYWIALLSPTGSGTMYIRDKAAGSASQNSSQANLATLPATWSAGQSWSNSAASVYLTGSTDTQAPVVSLTAPAAGTISGPVSVTATATDNIGITSVQFTLDGANLGSPIAVAPYTYTWDTTAATNANHTLGAIAVDTAGNSGTAAGVAVTVSNIDTTPPVISGTTASNVTPSGAVITWTTSEPGTSQVQFGTTATFSSSTVTDPTLVTSHSQTLTGLTPSTVYFCQVLSKDASANQAISATFSFTTPAAPDITPPVITNVREYGATSTGLTIGWTTDEASSSQVEYGSTTAYGVSTPIDVGAVVNHAVSLSGVPPQTTYHYRVKSKDVAGNLATSADDTASTAAPATNVPAVTIQKSIGWTSPTVQVGDTVKWLNDDPSGSAHTATSDSGVWNSGLLNTNDSFTWQFNTVGTYAYHCVIHGSAGVITVVDTTPPTISGVGASSITGSGGTLTWTTSEASDTQVEFGPTTAYGSSTALNTSLVTGHTQALTGLTASTLYHYRAKSKDGSGNLATSADLTFMTSAPLPTTVLGDTGIEAIRDNNSAGSAEAFQYTAPASGAANKLFVYLDATNTATQVIVGLYTSAGTNPGTLLAQGTISAPVKGAWNSVTIPATGITAGTKYWIAVLAPTGAGPIQFRDKSSGGTSQTSSQSNLSSLPATWSPGQTWASSSMSAYAQAP